MLNEDFEVHVSQTLDIDHNFTKLSYGVTEVPFDDLKLKFKTKSIRTYFFGTCHIIEPQFYVGRHFGLFWQVKLMTPTPIDKPKGIYLYLSSNETWHGIATQTWPKFNPEKAYLSFANDLYKIQFRTVKHSTLDGVEDTSKCLTSLQNSCQFFTDRISNEPTCNSTKELKELMEE